METRQTFERNTLAVIYSNNKNMFKIILLVFVFIWSLYFQSLHRTEDKSKTFYDEIRFRLGAVFITRLIVYWVFLHMYK